jgi:hypothetical protein
MPRLYGRKGFTTKKPLRELLTPYEQPSTDRPERIVIDRLPADIAVELGGHLPDAQHNDRATDTAPTLADLIVLAGDIDGALLSGYRIVPEQLDERITLDRITVPHGVLDHHKVAVLATALPDPSVIAIGPDGSVYASWQ